MIPILAALLLAGSAAAQTDRLAPVRVFEGKWTGPAVGQPGKGISTREYRFDMDGRFLHVRNKSVYEPKSPGAPPEVHEDFGVFSYDRTAKRIVLRQFHSEGFVNEYALEAASEDGKTLEFVTTRIENIAPGWRAKEAYRIISPDEFEETFSLAPAGKDFETYSRTRLKRVK